MLGLLVTALEDEDGPPFEEPVVLLVPPVGEFPLDHLLHQLKDDLFDLWEFLDWEEVHTVTPQALHDSAFLRTSSTGPQSGFGF